LNDSQVKDKKDIDNGIIEVHYYKELAKKDTIIIREEHHHHHHDRYPEPYIPWPKPYWIYSNHETVYDMRYGGTNCKGMSASADVGTMFSNCLCASAGMEGAAVRGSASDQKFQTVSGYEFESIATILKLKIVNGERVISQEKYCPGCGRKNRDGEKFCPSCGNKQK
jgi:hypothetical protein